MSSHRDDQIGIYQSPSSQKLSDELISNRTPHNTVTYVFSTYIAGCWRKVTVVWCKTIVSHSLDIMFNSSDGEILCSFKIDLKPWLFWSKKGSKPVDLVGFHVEIYWDLGSAKFSTNPEPLSDYYVAVVSDEEVAMFLGDCKKKAYKRTKARPALLDPILHHKKEFVCAKKSFATRAKLGESKADNEIVVESSTSGPKDPEMWISIDGVVVVHVKNLQWKFRGNQTAMMNRQQWQVYWDVHDWLFNSSGAGHGLFIFKPGALEESDRESSCNSDNSEGSRYVSAKSTTSTTEFCLFLHAWKMS